MPRAVGLSGSCRPSMSYHVSCFSADVVVIPVISGASMILTRNLLYTAVTRAKKMVVLVGTKQNIARMVHNSYTVKRYSMLKDFLLKEKENYSLLFSDMN